MRNLFIMRKMSLRSQQQNSCLYAEPIFLAKCSWHQEDIEALRQFYHVPHYTL